MVGSRRGQGCVEDPVSAASRKGRPSVRERERGEGVEDRKEDLYTRAKRRGASLPDRAKLNRKRQRTGI